MGKYKIFVDGSSGTTGLRIADRLAERDEFEILKISEADRKDVRARAAVINESDLSFLCLPDDAAREVVPLLRDDVRILDTSTAHRTAPGWVYGLPELHGTREALKTAIYAQCLLEPAGKIAAQNGTAGSTAAGKRQRSGSGTGQAKNSTASDLHRKNLLHKKLGPAQRRSRKKHGRHGAPVRPGAPQTDLI